MPPVLRAGAAGLRAMPWTPATFISTASVRPKTFLAPPRCLYSAVASRPGTKGTDQHSAPKRRKDKRETSDSDKMPGDARKEASNPTYGSDSGDSNAPLVSPTAEDLLKQRFLHAQKRTPGNTLMTGGSGTATDMPSFFRGRPSNTSDAEAGPSDTPSDTSLMGMPTAPEHEPEAKSDEPQPAKDESSFADTKIPFPAFQTAALAPIRPSHLFTLPDQPFDTHAFVNRLEEGGWRHPTKDRASGYQQHDPAEALMELTRSLLQQRGAELTEQHINRSDLDNQLYLFSSALAELRTEVRVRARNDGAALRSLSSLLQREIDGLSQKLQADVEQLKHDIQVDMNSRKTEVQEEHNNLEQEIQDLNNRFTIFVSDLRTEIEQSIKWDATRRALALVFGIVAILVCTLALADYMTRESDEAEHKHDDDKEQAKSPPGPSLRVPVPIDHTLEDDSSVLPPKSAEEWGLLPRYESDEARYV
ncbi:heme o synthase [Malassezia caprae]|uniref:Heme o synthase n=1 Tax=Malassezia caprae TaxID=1381934 RepID=A0AAF0E6S7_9BASI|nr:heme o synthase [Malassezia caprae]